MWAACGIGRMTGECPVVWPGAVWRSSDSSGAARERLHGIRHAVGAVTAETAKIGVLMSRFRLGRHDVPMDQYLLRGSTPAPTACAAWTAQSGKHVEHRDRPDFCCHCERKAISGELGTSIEVAASPRFPQRQQRPPTTRLPWPRGSMRLRYRLPSCTVSQPPASPLNELVRSDQGSPSELLSSQQTGGHRGLSAGIRKSGDMAFDAAASSTSPSDDHPGQREANPRRMDRRGSRAAPG